MEKKVSVSFKVDKQNGVYFTYFNYENPPEEKLRKVDNTLHRKHLQIHLMVFYQKDD
ncbi:MAG: hypothetical protein AAF620_14830 [Bacteroidota bacterium]